MEKKVRPLDVALESIQYYILENKMRPGERLPSERELSDAFGVNRTTLRSALQRLIKQGKIKKSKNTGYFIAPKKIIRDVQDIYSTSQFFAGTDYDFQTKIYSNEVIMANKILSKELKLPLGTDVCALKRIRFLEDQPIMLETSYIPNSLFKEIEHRDFENESLYTVLSEIGYSVERGFETIQVGLAQKQERNILKVEECDEIFIIRGTAISEDDTPLEYFNSIIRGDIVAFVTELT
ncbi:GntR family transcriptional regulator [Vagococcus elongatus]|uniref:GntR family transcriptional regulator n=1 Tax=Vagococcus elongatus TaxID=180344 RepID=A0A430API8_9ENTE|nr:GntR family transcriptional regulator [Vagococcus elongatus]RSU09976.1 GntR family transcriptional regulator [Vagococcus elongatus]